MCLYLPSQLFILNLNKMNNTYLKSLSLFFCASALFSCEDDAPIVSSISVPDTYSFLDASGESTVSFSGQTTRLQQVDEILTDLLTFGVTSEDLSEKFTEGEGFTDTTLNGTGKTVYSKIAASDDYYKENATESITIKTEINSFIEDQISEILGAYDALEDVPEASEGVIGQLDDRLLNSQGLEYNQMFAKSLVGALVLDQVVNNYLSRCLDATYQEQNSNGELVESKNYTTLEHYWDEAYGYIYGNADNDSLLYKYIVKVAADEDFAGIDTQILDAFKLGRAAIVAQNYNVLENQVTTLRTLLSKVVGVRAIYYLQQGKANLAYISANDASAFHDLSEGYGFIYSLQFTRNPNTDAPYFTKEEVDAYLLNLTQDNGLWDLIGNTTILDTISSEIATAFGVTVDEAGS